MSELQSMAKALIETIAEAAVEATPRRVLAAGFLLVAAIVVRLAVGRISGEFTAVAGNPAQQRLLELFVRVLLWFVVGLVTLALLGFEQLATALGTASGFLALGVAFALRQALSEVVAGLYLIKDEQFIQGQRITTDSETGTIEHVGLRRTKLRSDEDQDLTVISNDRIESKWKLHVDDGRPG
jgi:small-conductance mechanosensitive channel